MTPWALRRSAAAIAVVSSPSTVCTPSPRSRAIGSASGRVWSTARSARVPQSAQSVPWSHKSKTASSPPSSHIPSFEWKHELSQPFEAASARPAAFNPSEIDVAPPACSVSMALAIFVLSEVK